MDINIRLTRIYEVYNLKNIDWISYNSNTI